jgi:hypothetical protein
MQQRITATALIFIPKLAGKCKPNSKAAVQSLSVPPLRTLCLCGGCLPSNPHKDAKNTKDAQRKLEIGAHANPDAGASAINSIGSGAASGWWMRIIRAHAAPLPLLFYGCDRLPSLRKVLYRESRINALPKRWAREMRSESGNAIASNSCSVLIGKQ